MKQNFEHQEVFLTSSWFVWKQVIKQLEIFIYLILSSSNGMHLDAERNGRKSIMPSPGYNRISKSPVHPIILKILFHFINIRLLILLLKLILNEFCMRILRTTEEK